MVEKVIPDSLNEALFLLNKKEYCIVAGGSDIMLQKRNIAGELPRFSTNVMFISNLKELHYEKEDKEGLHIGATMTLEEILNHKLTPDVLKQCLSELASANIRHFATLPGNIANASPAGDTIVIDILLDAYIKLSSINGSRLIKASDFVKGVHKIDRQSNELIEEIIIPPYKFDKLAWIKVGSRKAESISKVSFAGAYLLEGNIIKDIRLAFGSIFVKAIRSEEIENEIKGLSLSQLSSRIDEFVEKYGNFISPIDDHRSNKEYRRTVTKNIVRKYLTELVEGGNR